MIYEGFALAAALCWALGSVVAAEPARALGGFHFVRVRMLMMTVVLWLIVAVWGDWGSVQAHHGVLLLSALVGIVFGDICLFACLSRLGPRRTSILFAINAPLAALFSYVFLGSEYGWLSLLGTALTVGGVVVAIWFGRQSPQAPFNIDEQTQGQLRVGVAFGLLAALGQASGSLLAKPVMDLGADPWTVSAFRVSVSAVAISALYAARLPGVPAYKPLQAKHWPGVFISGLFGMVLGMTLLMFAFARGDMGISAVLSSTTPVVILPVLWLKTRIAPKPMAWLGAGLCVLGSALLIYAPV